MKHLIILTLAAYVFVHMTAFSQIEDNWDENSSTTITEISVDGDPYVGDTIQLNASFRVNHSGTFTYNLQYSDAISPVNLSEEYGIIADSVEADSGDVIQTSYDLTVNKAGISDLTFSTLSKQHIPTFNDYSNSRLRIKSGSNPEILSPNFDDDEVEVFNQAVPYWSEGTNSVDIKGEIRFYDEWMYNSAKGAFNTVWLWFVNPNNPNTLYHPVSTFGGGYIEGTHFAKCNEEGYYEFNFSFNQSVDIPEELEIWIFIAKNNDAVKLYSPSDHLKINLLDEPNSIRTLLTIDKIDIDQQADNHNYNFYDIPDTDNDNHTIIIDPLDGQAFRYATLSRMFIKERFDVADYSDLPFNEGYSDGRLPMVELEIKPGGFDASYSNKFIHVQPFWTRSVIIFHEYGHYLDHCMHPEGLDNGGCGSSLNTEAFAMFYSSCVGAWSNNKFDDRFAQRDNCEMGPFYYFTRERENIYDVRFGCLNKT